MTWTGDQFSGPFGNGPHGPDWTPAEKKILKPLAEAVLKARMNCQWLNEPNAVRECIPAAFNSGEGALDLVESCLNSLKQAKADLEEAKTCLRPNRCKRDGTPYQAAHWETTRPKNDSIDQWLIEAINKQLQEVR